MITTPVQAPRMRVPAGSGLCSSPCPRASIRLGLAPPHPEAALSGAGTHFGVGQLPDVTTWGGGSVPPPPRKPAGGSTSRAPPGSRSAKGAPALEHSAGTHGIGPPALGPGGRSPLGAWEGGVMPDSAREPAGGSSSRAPPGSRGARDGQALGWRDAVAEAVRSEVTRSLVTMLMGSMPRPAERWGRVRRSSRRRRRDNSTSSSTTDVSRSGDESAVAALLGAFIATPTPSTVREGTRGIDPGTQPTPDSAGGVSKAGERRQSYPGISTRGSRRNSSPQSVRRRRGGRLKPPRHAQLGWCRPRLW